MSHTCRHIPEAAHPKPRGSPTRLYHAEGHADVAQMARALAS
jgi:hypothetical protein